VSTPLHDPRDGQEPDDVSIVPGLGPSGPLDSGPGRHEPPPSAYPAVGPLDLSKDPDRYHPDRDDAGGHDDITAVGGPLDRSLDPDRYRPPGQGQTLTDLLGDGAHEEKRDNMQWAYGLLSILAFLAVVSWFFNSFATP
jgi:hypothetical protein